MPISGPTIAARAVVDPRTVSGSISYLSNNGGFTDAGLSRVSAGVYRLTLSRSVNTSRAEVQCTAESPDTATKLISEVNYRWISSTVLEVIVSDTGGYGVLDARVSVSVTEVL